MKRRNMHKQLLGPLHQYASACELYVHKQNNATARNMKQRTRELLFFFVAYHEQELEEITAHVGIYA